jgi:hypothetical protein
MMILSRRFRLNWMIACLFQTGVSPNGISVDYITSDVEEYTAWYLEPTLDGKVEGVFESPNYPGLCTTDTRIL